MPLDSASTVVSTRLNYAHTILSLKPQNDCTLIYNFNDYQCYYCDTLSLNQHHHHHFGTFILLLLLLLLLFHYPEFIHRNCYDGWWMGKWCNILLFYFRILFSWLFKCVLLFYLNWVYLTLLHLRKKQSDFQNDNIVCCINIMKSCLLCRSLGENLSKITILIFRCFVSLVWFSFHWSLISTNCFIVDVHTPKAI